MREIMTDLTTVPKRKPRSYLNNRSLLEQVIKSKEQGKMTDELAKMLMLLCSNLAQKGNFVNYSYNDDMQAFGLMTICKAWEKFDPTVGSNCFAYYTQVLKNAFIQYLKHEKKQRDIRDTMLVDMGMNPSYSYSEGGEVVVDEFKGIDSSSDAE